MKSLLFTLTAVIATSAWCAPEWEDETVFQVNREAPRAALLPTAKGTTMSLNGQWKFSFVMRPDLRPIDFWKTSYDTSTWDTIQVPLSWQMAGYGTPIYSNEQYPFKVAPPRVTAEPPKSWTAYNERNSVGSYKRTFTLPEDFSKGRVYVRFDGVESAYYLWINDTYIGYSEDSFTAGEFDITSALKPGENTISLEVYRWCDGSYLEDQDFWRLAGIFRDVTLFTTPTLQIRDVWVRPTLADDYTTGIVEGDVWVRNMDANASQATTLTVKIGDIYTKTLRVPALASGAEVMLPLPSVSIANVDRWTAETPNLYPVTVSLPNGDGRAFNTGFRRIEVGPKGELLVNGVSVIIKGVNRHEMDPDLGRYMTRERIEQDIALAKATNFNAIRTSHYPNTPYFYEVCDREGIYVMDEANIEAHEIRNSKHCLNDVPSWHAAYEFRIHNMFHRDKNYPSIIMWSLGNETGPGKNLEDQGDWLMEIDKNRLTHYCDFPKNSPHNHMDSAMYRTHDALEGIAKHYQHRPFLHVEYAHSMGNACGSFHEYIAIYEKYPRMIGGFIWDFVDQSLRADYKVGGIAKVNPIQGNALVWGSLFGDAPNFGSFCDNGVYTADRLPKGQTTEIKHAQQYFNFAYDYATEKLTITSKYFHKRTQDLALYNDKGERLASLPDLAPGESCTISLPRTQTEPCLDEVVFIADASLNTKKLAIDDFAEAWHVIKTPTPAHVRVTPSFVPPVKATYEEKNGTLVVKNDTSTLTFKDGVLASLVCDGKEMIEEPLSFNLYRAPVNNDRWIKGSATWRSLYYQQNECLEMTYRTVDTGIDANIIQVVAKMKTKGGSVPYNYTLVWTVLANTITVEGVFNPTSPEEVIPRLGFTMAVSKDLQEVAYEALGPWENYSDRKDSVWRGRFKTTVADLFVPYSETQENGNRCEAHWFMVGDTKKALCFFPAMTGNFFNFSILPWDARTLFDSHVPGALPTSEKVWINIDYAQTGLGNGSCGPRPLPQYLVYNRPFVFGFAMRYGERPFRTKPYCETAGLAVVSRDSKNMVTVTPYRPDVKVEVTLNNDKANSFVYTAPFKFESGTVTVKTIPADPTVLIPMPATTTTFAREVTRAAWKVVDVSSEEPGEGNVAQVFDNNPKTYWHSDWRNVHPDYPHHFTLDFGETNKIAGVKLLPRNDTTNGLIGECQIEFSADGKTWETAFKGKTGWTANNRSLVTLDFKKAYQARYVRFTATAPAIKGHIWATLSEFSIIVH